MQFDFNAFSLTLLTFSALTVFLSILIFQKLGSIVRWFGGLMLAIAIWAAAYGLELASSSLSQMLFWINVEYIGIASLPTLWIVFIIKFIGKDKWLKVPLVGPLFLFSLCTLLMVWTNPYHHLHYQHTSVYPGGVFPLLSIKPGIWYYLNTAYFYFLLAWGIYLLISRFSRTEPIFKIQTSIILIGALTPWFVNLLYLLGIRPFHHLDLTPFAFLFSVLVIAIGLLRFRLFDVVPIARDKVIEAMKEGYLVLDAQGRIVDINSILINILNGSKKEMIGKSLRYYFSSQEVAEKLQNPDYEGDIDISFDVEGKPHFFEIRCKTLFEKNTVFSGRLLMFRDITEYKRAHIKLQTQATELKDLNQVKDRLLSIISHDLRGPLASLTQVLELNEQGHISEEEVQQVLPNLSKNLNYTVELFENLLFWAKGQLNGEVINPVELDLIKLINEKIAFFSSKIEEKKIHIKEPEAKKVWVYADQVMVEIVIRNLLSNAIKFCHAGDEISFEIKEGVSTVILCIIDTGVGIAPENVERIFKIETFSTRGTGDEQGTGLGLALSKDFIEKNGGKIWLESTPGVGTTFYVSIPKIAPVVQESLFH